MLALIFISASRTGYEKHSSKEVAAARCNLLAICEDQGKHARRTRRSSVRHVKINRYGYSCLCLSSLVSIVACLRAQGGDFKLVAVCLYGRFFVVPQNGYSLFSWVSLLRGVLLGGIYLPSSLFYSQPWARKRPILGI